MTFEGRMCLKVLENDIHNGFGTELLRYKKIYDVSAHDENAEHYYQTMINYLQKIEFYVDRLQNNTFRSDKISLYDVYKHLFGFIFGSFDMPKPNRDILKTLRFRYNPNLFLRTSVKTKWAAEIIVENE